MKNFLKYFILLVFVISISCVAFLSIKGYETDKFNDIIEEKINKVETDINLKLTKIKIKIEIKSLDLFFSTNEANLIYKDFDIPIKDIKIYLHGPSLIQSEIYIKKLSLKVENLKVKTIQDFATRIKPSNFKLPFAAAPTPICISSLPFGLFV